MMMLTHWQSRFTHISDVVKVAHIVVVMKVCFFFC